MISSKCLFTRFGDVSLNSRLTYTFKNTVIEQNICFSALYIWQQSLAQHFSIALKNQPVITRSNGLTENHYGISS